ncbi:MAG: hypothetical protein DRP18_03825, partial [Candidatus Aenigmatarchaeota archaeon]
MRINNLRWVSVFFVVMIVLILPSSSCSAFWGLGHAPEIKKQFHPHIKQLTLTNSDTKQQLQIKSISKKEGVCKFEEIFEITALGSDYTPKKGRDFGLRFRNKTHNDASDKIKSIEWYVWEDNEWQPLKWNWLGKTKAIKKNETKLYKVVVTKKRAEMGDKRILTIPKFMDIEDERLTWWNVSWKYRINSTLNNVPNGGYIYQLRVHSESGTNNQTDVFLNNHNATNFSDIRFVLDDTTELDYWIENNSTDPIKVFVKVPTNGTIYMYYGNLEVSSTAKQYVSVLDNPSFETGDLTSWTVHQGTLDSLSVDNTTYYDGLYSSYFHHHVDSDTDQGEGYIEQNTSFYSYPGILECNLSLFVKVYTECGGSWARVKINDVEKYSGSPSSWTEVKIANIENNTKITLFFEDDTSCWPSTHDAWFDYLHFTIVSAEPFDSLWSSEETEPVIGGITQYNT